MIFSVVIGSDICKFGGYCDICMCGTKLMSMKNDYYAYMIAFWVIVIVWIIRKGIDWEGFKRKNEIQDRTED